MTLSYFEWQRGFFATAELLVELAKINCRFASASGSLNLCMKIMEKIYWLDIIIGQTLFNMPAFETD